MKYISYRENRKHGRFDFPVEFYHVTPTHPRYEMSYHWHIEYEIIRVLKGELLLTVNEDEFKACSGDIVFVKGGFLHGGLPRNCLYECLVFNLDSLILPSHAGERLLKKITEDAVEVPSFFPSGKNSTNNADIRQLARITDTLFGQMQARREGYELTVIGSLYQFFGYILEHGLCTEAPVVRPRTSRRIEHLKKTLELIETSYAECLTLDDLAAAAGMNSKYFCRYFREMTHRTPIDYLNYYRIEQACFRLATSDDSITDVGLSCGFNDVSYFIKMFRKYKGSTPKKYLSAPL